MSQSSETMAGFDAGSLDPGLQTGFHCQEEEMPLDIAVIGTGHVGLITAGTLARFGHRVIGVDDNRDTIASLRSRVT